MVSGNNDPEYGRPFTGVQVQASLQGGGGTGPQGPAGPQGLPGVDGGSGAIENIVYPFGYQDITPGVGPTNVVVATLQRGDAIVYGFICYTTTFVGNTVSMTLKAGTAVPFLAVSLFTGAGGPNPLQGLMANLGSPAQAYRYVNAATGGAADIDITLKVTPGSGYVFTVLTAEVAPPTLPLTVITDVNDQFRIDINSGVSLAVIPAGDYATAADIAEAMAEAILVAVSIQQIGSESGGCVVLTDPDDLLMDASLLEGNGFLVGTGITNGQVFGQVQQDPLPYTAGSCLAVVGIVRGLIPGLS